MAIYHMTTGNVSRSAGQSSVKSAAYRERGAMTDERTGERVDYRRAGRGNDERDHVLHSEVVAPEGAAAWASKDRARLWNEVERQEDKLNKTHKDNARTAKTFIVALPHELTTEQNVALVKTFAERYVKQGLVVDFSIHAEQGGNKNVHAHLAVTTRAIEGDHFASRKERSIDKNVKPERHRWAGVVNEALERAGRPERVTALSLKDQKIYDRKPGVHQGRGPNPTRDERLTERAELKKNNRELAGLEIEKAQLLARGSDELTTTKRAAARVEKVRGPVENVKGGEKKKAKEREDREPERSRDRSKDRGQDLGR